MTPDLSILGKKIVIKLTPSLRVQDRKITVKNFDSSPSSEIQQKIIDYLKSRKSKNMTEESFKFKRIHKKPSETFPNCSLPEKSSKSDHRKTLDKRLVVAKFETEPEISAFQIENKHYLGNRGNSLEIFRTQARAKSATHFSLESSKHSLWLESLDKIENDEDAIKNASVDA